jgi:hypothetical protein
VRRRPADTLLVWDEIYGNHNSDSEMCVSRQLLQDNGWTMLRRFTRNDRTWEVFVAQPSP